MKKRTLPALQAVGFVARLHGFKGDLVLAVENGDPEKIGQAPYLFLELEGIPVPFKCMEHRMHRGDLIIHLESIDSSKLAEPLLQSVVLAERKYCRQTAEQPGWEELTGYHAMDASFGNLGQILEVQEFPMQYLARCEVNGQEVLLPLNDSTVDTIDEENRQVNFRLPAGLLDVYLKPGDDEEEELE